MKTGLSMEQLRVINQKIVGVLVFSADGKFVVGKKAPHPQAGYQEYWHIPGGGIEDNETDEDAARREVLEETGIDCKGIDITFVDDQGTGEAVRTLNSGELVLCKMKFYVYRIDLPQTSQEINVSPVDREFAEIRWFLPNDLNNSQVQFVPATYGLFERLGLK
jgi:8-oxo-dGTP pyrophosphatase MutT (NUDIX family)